MNDSNTTSVKMHEKYGFRTIGLLEKTGYKYEEWHGVVLMEKILNEQKIPPAPIIPIGELDYNFI